MHARIRTARWESDGVMSFTLEPLAGEHFPPCTAGAHIDVHLANGINRSYSLLNDGSVPDFYEIAVQCAPDSRGGSRFIHENWRAGQVINIAPPRNNFVLDEEAQRTLFISGGIGLTPMLAMIDRLQALGRPWTLHHAFRRRDEAALVDRLAGHAPSQVVLHDDIAGTSLDMRALIADTEAGTHIYCCGPERMLAAFTELTADRPAGFAHLEYFSGCDIVPADGGYTLALQRSGKTIEVEAGETMLDALLNAGVNVGFACSEGICGSCRVQVLGGIPDHRDRFLTPEEKNANPLVGDTQPTLDKLATYPWIVGPVNSPLRAEWERLFTGRSLPDCPIECGSVMIIGRLLTSGNFLTVLTPDQVALQIRSGLLASVGPPLSDSRFLMGITTRKGWRPTAVQRAFMAQLQQVADDLLSAEPKASRIVGEWV